MKLCRDCKHYQRQPIISVHALCAKATSVDPVEGEETHLTCQDARHTATLCGPEGAWFEPKTP